MCDTKLPLIKATGNAGLGYEVARQILEDASVHVLLGSRSTERGQQAVKELQGGDLKGSVEVLTLDVSQEEQIAKAAKLVEEKYGRSVFCHYSASTINEKQT